MNVRALAVAAFLLTVEPLHAQRTVAAAAGSRIRVRSQDGREWRVGRLIQSPPDTLILRQCDSCATQTYLLSSLADVQVSMGRARSGSTALKGGLIGMVVGLAGGWLYAWNARRNCSPGNDLCGFADLAVPVYGFGGLFIGLGVGGAIQQEIWKPATIR